MVSHKNYHLNANEEYFISLTSKLITHFIDSFTSGWNPNQLLICQVEVNIYIYIYMKSWALKLICTQIWVLWTRRPSRMQGQFLFLFYLKINKIRWDKQHFSGWVHKSFYGATTRVEGCGSRAPILILSWGAFHKELFGRALVSGNVIEVMEFWHHMIVGYDS